MSKPYVILHMLTSIDGKVTGDFLTHPFVWESLDTYYEINRQYNADAYACGRVTMQESFCGTDAPDLSQYEPYPDMSDFWCEDTRDGFYAVAFDPHGVLNWKSNIIHDEDPGYGGAKIIEILTEQADPRYLTMLRKLGISYIVAGKEQIDVAHALERLGYIYKIKILMLEGGSILDGAFAEADLIDELSIVVCPEIADTEDKPLFMKSRMLQYDLADVKRYGNSVWLNYKKDIDDE